MHEDQQRERILNQMADALARRQLLAPARLMLDIIEPVGFLASQAALFARPFTPYGRWREYVGALADEAGWRALHEIVKRREC